MRLENKVAIVTGAASGMRYEDAKLFAKEGARGIATDLQYDSLSEPEREVKAAGGTILVLQHNVPSEKDWISVVDRAVKEFGAIDILVNNAGISEKNAFTSNIENSTP
ncbi:SDR family NAD(P)-dependent oxidoreductase [Dyadobacter sp. OTU695]|uniref:SDR family NAD(P)-dependent oxidoreductase n=1 Tax=Dyadobacter sp. OTU695 TaxID=3043860 RepID=UPI00313C10A0